MVAAAPAYDGQLTHQPSTQAATVVRPIVRRGIQHAQRRLEDRPRLVVTVLEAQQHRLVSQQAHPILRRGALRRERARPLHPGTGRREVLAHDDLVVNERAKQLQLETLGRPVEQPGHRPRVRVRHLALPTHPGHAPAQDECFHATLQRRVLRKGLMLVEDGRYPRDRLPRALGGRSPQGGPGPRQPVVDRRRPLLGQRMVGRESGVVGGVQPADDVGGLAMQVEEAAPRQRQQGHLAQQGVVEAIAAKALDQDAVVDEKPLGRQAFTGRQRREGAQLGMLDPQAQHGRGLEHPPRRLGQAIEAGFDHGLQVRRQGLWLRRAVHVPPRRDRAHLGQSPVPLPVAAQLARLSPAAQQLGQVERIALAGRHGGRGEPVVELPTDGDLEQRPCALGAQALQPHARSGVRGIEGADRGPVGRVRTRLAAPIAGQHEQTALASPTADGGQGREAIRIGGVQVVQLQQDRHDARPCAEELAEGLVKAWGGHGLAHRRRDAKLGQPRRDRRDGRREHLEPHRRDQLRHLGEAQRGQGGVDGPADRAVGEAFPRARPAREHLRPAPRGVPGDLGQEPRLADPGLALQQHETATAVDHRLDVSHQAASLLRAPDQRQGAEVRAIVRHRLHGHVGRRLEPAAAGDLAGQGRRLGRGVLAELGLQLAAAGLELAQRIGRAPQGHEQAHQLALGALAQGIVEHHPLQPFARHLQPAGGPVESRQVLESQQEALAAPRALGQQPRGVHPLQQVSPMERDCFSQRPFHVGIGVGALRVDLDEALGQPIEVSDVIPQQVHAGQGDRALVGLH